jgi:hypothetical protein
VLSVSGAYLWREGIPSSVGKATANTAPVRPVPVTAGLVKEQEFAISRVGLGMDNTVTVKVRVDGEVQKIAFREGQNIQVGDLIAQIDPRPYQAQLHQAEADKARDEALLANARLDLERYSKLAVATVIPGITVPLSLIGTFAVMYVLGYSLDNLSLMALTIATGFVVDDAIVMVENVARYLEQGYSPFAAALKGSREIGFTIISMSLSLIAVFIPVLLMGGIIGRLFREFAVTVSVAILASTIISLTLTPMMCAQLLQHERRKRHGRLYALSEKFFDGMLAVYEPGLCWVLRHQRLTLTATVATIILTGYLYVLIPKGFFPQQDTGFIVAVSESSPDVSYPAMLERQAQLIRVLMADPGVDGVMSAVGVGGVNQTMNNARMFINLKPRDQRDASARSAGFGVPCTELAHPTRFERVTFAFGGQRLFYVANRGAICSTIHKKRVLQAGFEPARQANHHNFWLPAFRCWPICLAPIP